MAESQLDTAGSHRIRTALAWRRTVLSAAIVALLAIRLKLRGGMPVQALVISGLSAGGWLVVLAVATRRIRALAGPDNPVVRRAVVPVAIATVGYAVLGVAILVLTRA